MFNAENRQQLEASFREFAARPENKPLLEQHQQEEVRAALELQERMQELALQQEVQGLDEADQKLLGPVLRSPVLRQLLSSMTAAEGSTPHASKPSTTNSTAHAWLTNPRVLQLLREAARALRKGCISEQQLLELLQRQLKAQQDAAGQHSADAPSAAPHQAQLPSHLLVEALNEHLEERRAGNAAYQRRAFNEALRHYRRALAVVKFVVGASAHDQAEVERNKAAALLNMAAVHLATQEWGAAVRCCDEALQLPEAALQDAAGKALLRRAKANLGRHEYQAALDDLRLAAAAEPWNEEVTLLRARVLAERRATTDTLDRSLAARMLGQ